MFNCVRCGAPSADEKTVGDGIKLSPGVSGVLYKRPSTAIEKTDNTTKG